MSASGGTVVMDMSSGVHYHAENARTNENETSATAEKTDMLTSEKEGESEVTVQGQTRQEAVSHPLQLSEGDTSPESLSPDNENKNNKNNKKGRRVVFIEGSIVSGYMDPPSPWNDVKSCSTEELIAAYLASCDKQNIKPIPRLLQQLHAITNFCDRNDTLSLRGERLDGRHCETLEEILRRVQFRTIDLEATHLEEEGAISLFDMIEYYESCLRLNISYNRTIGPRGWHACSRMIKKTPCLEHLEARHCTISEQVMPMLGRSLRMGSSLTILHLENSILSGRPLMILVAAIKMNDTLRELFLADNKLMPTDGIQLGNLLKLNHHLQVLDARNNHLQDNGVGHICEGLYEQNQGHGLTTLVLWNNQITFQAMHNLARALYSTHNLETLNLGHNNITNEGIHRLKEGLLSNNSLQRIGLQAAKISCEGAVALAEYIAESKSLLRLDLRENEIKTGGLMAVSLALKMCTSIHRVDLDKEPKKESGVKDYADQQRRLHQDINNYMQRNRELARQQQEEEEKRMKEDLEKRLAKEEEPDLKPSAETSAESAPTGEEVGAGESANKEKEAESEQQQQREQMRLNLNLPLFSRSQELESPAFVRETDLPVITPPEVEIEETEETKKVDVEELLSRETLPGEFPPSPMVSNNGSPMLAHIPEATLSPPTTPTSTTPVQKDVLTVPQKQKRRSPSPHKFVISRVKESPPKDMTKDTSQAKDTEPSPVVSAEKSESPSVVQVSSEPKKEQATSAEKSESQESAQVSSEPKKEQAESAEKFESQEPAQELSKPLKEQAATAETSQTQAEEPSKRKKEQDTAESGAEESSPAQNIVSETDNKTEIESDTTKSETAASQPQSTGTPDTQTENAVETKNVAEPTEEGPGNESPKAAKDKSLPEGGDVGKESSTEDKKMEGESLNINGIKLDLVEAMQEESNAGEAGNTEADDPALNVEDDFEKELDEMLAGVISTSN